MKSSSFPHNYLAKSFLYWKIINSWQLFSLEPFLGSLFAEKCYGVNQKKIVIEGN